MKKKSKRWQSDMPTLCQLCRNPFLTNRDKFFVDAKIKGGPWGLLCGPCHSEHGIGLGEGKGQKYRLSDGMMLEGGSLS